MQAPVAEEEAPMPLKGKGGLKTLPCIMANEILEKVASFGLHANMIVYLTKTYNMSPAAGAIVLFIWGAASNFTPIFGAFLSDSFLGRFRVIAIGSFVSLIGMALLWLTAVVPGAQPPACGHANDDCASPTSSQLAFLFAAFAVMSVGSGGVRPCSLAFGADQLDQKGAPQNERTLQTFFNWYYASVGISIIVAVTVIVYVQDYKGWAVGFGVPVVLMAISAALFLLGSPFYIKFKANKSILAGLAQVIVVSLKNRHIVLPPDTNHVRFHNKKGSKLTVPTKKLRFLNKACVIRNQEKDLNPDGTASNAWNLCTVEQVEVLKSVVRVLPIWSSSIMVAVVISQYSFPVLQAGTMDRHIGSKFQIPAGSFVVFSIITLTLWVAIYDRLVVPPLSKITGRPRGFSLRQRMGIGQVLSCMATAAAAVTEGARRRRAIEQGLADDPQGMVNMSAMWLVPQNCLTGLAEALNLIGQLEFYYSEFPRSMASVAVSLLTLGMGFGNLVSSVITALVNKISGADGGASWLDRNINKGHLDYYYWILTLLGIVNIFYFMACSLVYGEEGQDKIWDDDSQMKQDLHSARELPIAV
ncbi:protein NRT1/ PTR FAMILY 1.2-like [Musa acuminata AAA Group]|uniref:protein NRT1/ PTR FAMILY 1.2-like n=1 Tax=Musa acuminata AAA Group TaxID=214697 RepID=UPI000295D069|nr:PREDICTED: protein NRT1/ PTR FAMILY 1.2-like isoform X2 [Musa acuminata subsp. malaccensis]